MPSQVGGGHGRLLMLLVVVLVVLDRVVVQGRRDGRDWRDWRDWRVSLWKELGSQLEVLLVWVGESRWMSVDS